MTFIARCFVISCLLLLAPRSAQGRRFYAPTAPTISPSPTESPAPSPSPSETPTETQSPSKSPRPSVPPSASPSQSPSTHQPSVSPTESPAPSPSPSEVPSPSPSERPSVSFAPTTSPAPSVSPSQRPSFSPSQRPSMIPSVSPSMAPSRRPSSAPSKVPSASPSNRPSATPSASPSAAPSHVPSISPSDVPSVSPSRRPTSTPSASPTRSPSAQPSLSQRPSFSPSATPSASPSQSPTDIPSAAPSPSPTTSPKPSPSPSMSAAPSATPTLSHEPTFTSSPTVMPTEAPTGGPRLVAAQNIEVNTGRMGGPLEGNDLERFEKHALEFLTIKFQGPEGLRWFTIHSVKIASQSMVDKENTDATGGPGARRSMQEQELLVLVNVEATVFPGDLLYDYHKAFEIAFEGNIDEFHNNLYVMGLQGEAPERTQDEATQKSASDEGGSFPVAALGAVGGAMLSIMASLTLILWRKSRGADDETSAAELPMDQYDIQDQPSVISLSDSENSSPRNGDHDHDAGDRSSLASASTKNSNVLKLDTIEMGTVRTNRAAATTSKRPIISTNSNIEVPEQTDSDQPETPHDKRVSNFLDQNLSKIVGTWTKTISKEITGAWNRQVSESLDGAERKKYMENKRHYQDVEKANCAATFPSGKSGSDVQKAKKEYFRQFANDRKQHERTLGIPFVIRSPKMGEEEEELSDFATSPLSQDAVLETHMRELARHGSDDKMLMEEFTDDDEDDDDVLFGNGRRAVPFTIPSIQQAEQQRARAAGLGHGYISDASVSDQSADN